MKVEEESSRGGETISVCSSCSCWPTRQWRWIQENGIDGELMDRVVEVL